MEHASFLTKWLCYMPLILYDLVRFETFIRYAFVQKQHVLAIFFDMEKAYDTTWKHGILSDLWAEVISPSSLMDF